MSRKPGAGQKGSKLRADRTSPSRLESSAESNKNPRKIRKTVRGRLHPPPEEDLGRRRHLLVGRAALGRQHAARRACGCDTVREAEFEHYNPKRSLGAVAIALTVAVFGALSLLIVDHGLWNRPHVESARAHAATEAAAEADGAIVTSTRRPSLYSRNVRRGR